jgi:hypothetical protein
VDFNAVLLLAAVWFVVSLLSRGSRKTKAPPGQVSRDPLRPKSLPSTPDATQREGLRLELVLRDFQRALEQAQSAGRSGGIVIPEEEIEERASLETEPEVRSLEGDVRRAQRKRVDQDDEAEQIEARRIAAAAARDATRTRADRTTFDERIRQEPADHTATTSRYTAQQLRDAMVWREILGPPVSDR